MHGSGRLCACGCGQATPIATRNNRRLDYVRGRPLRFQRGHYVRFCRPVAERFWEKVDRSGGPDACWEWTGTRLQKGYGRIGVDGEKVLTHRLAYELTRGLLLPGFEICHSCDNPPCANPAHLFPGSDADNKRDMVAKGRQARGTQINTTKLTINQVLEIGRCAIAGESQRALARRFGVAQASVSRVLTGRTWAWLQAS